MGRPPRTPTPIGGELGHSSEATAEAIIDPYSRRNRPSYHRPPTPGRTAVANRPRPDSRSYLLSVRASVIFALSVLVGGAAAALTVVSGAGWAKAVLAGGAATGAAIALFNQIIGDVSKNG
jgi:hypothetical protein